MIKEVLESCLRANMIIPGENESFTASDIGKLCAQKGIKVRTALWFSEWMQNTDPDKLSDFELLFTAALSQDGQEIEQKYFAPAGAIQKTAQEFSWLLEALSRMAELKGWKSQHVQKLQELS